MTAAELEAILRAVAPIDLAGLQVYAGLETELQFGMHPCGCWATTRFGIDIELRRHLGERWRGRGIGMLIADNHVRSAYPPDVASLEILGLALHELAHNLAWLPLARRCNAFAQDADGDDRTRAHVQESLQTMSSGDRRAVFVAHQFHDHGEKWIRAALHCLQRVRALGQDVCIPAVIDLQRGGVERAANAWHYYRALGDEPTRMSACSFAEILETPPPSEFRALWEMECANFADEENHA